MGTAAPLASLPYRHRVGDVASTPAVTLAASATLGQLATTLADLGISSVVIDDGDGLPRGILTERDVLRAVATGGGDALAAPVAAYMSAPVETVAADAFLHVALARMARTGRAHLVVTGPDGRIVGVVTARGLLRRRVGEALVLGDQVAAATDAAGLAEAVALLPATARALRDDGMAAHVIAAVIAATIRDVTGRAADLAANAMEAQGHGPAPAPWACLVLGSAGRGETLLVPDQDNALIWRDGAADSADAWFAALGDRMTAMLDAAGIPLCKGGVMASNPHWRGSLATWRARVDGWLARHRPEDLLDVDIFFDMAVVAGDHELGTTLQGAAVAAAQSQPVFLKLLGERAGERGTPFGLFGSLRTEGGRIDLKRSGLLPLVAAARVAALAQGELATATRDRLQATAPRVNAETREALAEAHELLLGAILDQQITDIAAGTPASNRVALAPLSRATRRRLTEALHALDGLPLVVRDLLRAD
ncbi:MAG: DUF294 nucleotidyltransferase-like domain-containing protein [Alphaproteobacteria bacterium]